MAETHDATGRARRLAAEYGWSATAGVHPHEARRWDAAARATVEEALADAQEKVDNYRDCMIANDGFNDREAQQACVTEVGGSMPGVPLP